MERERELAELYGDKEKDVTTRVDSSNAAAADASAAASINRHGGNKKTNLRKGHVLREHRQGDAGPVEGGAAQVAEAPVDTAASQAALVGGVDDCASVAVCDAVGGDG